MKSEVEFYIRIVGMPALVSIGGIVAGFVLALLANLWVNEGSPWALLALPLGLLAAVFCLYRNYYKHSVRFWRATRITFAFLGVHWVVLVLVVQAAYPEGMLAYISPIDLLLDMAPVSLAVVGVISLACSGIYAGFVRRKLPPDPDLGI